MFQVRLCLGGGTWGRASVPSISAWGQNSGSLTEFLWGLIEVVFGGLYMHRTQELNKCSLLLLLLGSGKSWILSKLLLNRRTKCLNETHHFVEF